MQFEDAQDLPTAFLILRHLYDGDVIEWPIAEDHPFRYVFVALETQGYVARWDRMWPLHDRYRLTDKGIAAIERVYQPAGAEAIYNEVRSRNLSAAQRRAYLQQQGYDPVLWPLLHDPTTHWERYHHDHGGYYDWFWDDQPSYSDRDDQPSYSDRDDQAASSRAASSRAVAAVPYVVDLDREAGRSSDRLAGADAPDHDVS
jgi:hypothetical protein